MSFVAEVKAEPPYRKKAWVEAQLGDEAEEFRQLLADPTVRYGSIWRALRKRGIDVPDRTVYRWCQEARRALR